MNDLFTSDLSYKVIRVLLLALGFGGLYVITRLLDKYLSVKYSPQVGMITRKLLLYIGFAILFSLIMQELGFNLTTILGAAGIAGIAIGFAAQTSLSNLISGLFLIGEKHFQIGDIINIESKTGVVVSIDLMSVKIKTFDNHFIRIPNESLIKSHLSNITKYPIRRADINISVAYKSDLKKVIEVLKEVAHKNLFCLEDPEPLILIKEFGNSSIDILVGLWMVKTDFLNLKNSIMIEIKEAFERENIEIPFPQRVVHVSNSDAEFKE